MPAAIYTAENCSIAYQLHWSLSVFATQPLPPENQWRRNLAAAIEPDGIRLLEVHSPGGSTYQVLLSTRPDKCPAAIIQSVKGRWQHLLRDTIPKVWQRQYSIVSVGDTNCAALDEYVARQPRHHRFTDPRVVDLLEQFRFHDPQIDLTLLRSSSHGKFIYNLQVVLQNRDNRMDLRPEHLTASQRMIIAACKKKNWQLSQVGFAGNHLHALIGCGITDSPREVGLSLVNNLSYAHGLKAIYDFSFYVGSFGPYDHWAIRHRLN